MYVNLMESVNMRSSAMARMGRDGSVQLTDTIGQALANLSKLRCLPITGAGHAKPASYRDGDKTVSWPVDFPRGLQAGRPACASASISTSGPAMRARASVLLEARERLQQPPTANVRLGRSAWKNLWTIGVSSVPSYAR
jgi:hypothetical protein